LAVTDRPLGELTASVLRAAREAGLDAIGVTDAAPFADTLADLEQRKSEGLHGGMAFTYRNPRRSTDPQSTVTDARSLVVGARSYRRAAPVVPEGPARHGFVARYSWQDHYAPLREGLEAAAGVLRSAGHRARVLVDDNALVDRAAAHRAGLGWWGKNSNLLLPGGSWFVLGSVVTDAALESTAEPVADGCGSCTRCIDDCPTGAIVAPGVVDARRCLAWLLQAPGEFPAEYREALGGRIYGCDECQEVCPPNRLGDRREPAPPPSGGDEPWVDLVELLALDDEALLGRYGRWYIAQREPRYVRRNALVALGNIARAADEAAVAAIQQYAEGDDDLLAEHARWAVARIDERERGGALVP
jgi:epoxyqueuosine reductase